MRKAGWIGALLLFLPFGAPAVEVGLVTAVSGNVRLLEEKAAASALAAFVKLREGDRLTLQGNARLQIVFFDGGRQETWQGAGALEVGRSSSQALKGSVQAEVRTLPAILVRQLAKTPSADGAVKTGMIRMRSMPALPTLPSVDANYAELRQQAEAADYSPELYLLASYFELREYDRIEVVLKQLHEKHPGEAPLATLDALYLRAIGNAKAADGH